MNPFERVALTLNPEASGRRTAGRLALACRVAHDMDQIFAVLRALDHVDGHPGGHYASWLHGPIFAGWDWSELNDAAHAYLDARRAA